MSILTYRVRMFPLRCTGELIVALLLIAVELLICDSWLALVRGNRGDGLPVPGRTGGVPKTIVAKLYHNTK